MAVPREKSRHEDGTFLWSGRTVVPTSRVASRCWHLRYVVKIPTQSVGRHQFLYVPLDAFLMTPNSSTWLPPGRSVYPQWHHLLRHLRHLLPKHVPFPVSTLRTSNSICCRAFSSTWPARYALYATFRYLPALCTCSDPTVGSLYPLPSCSTTSVLNLGHLYIRTRNESNGVSLQRAPRFRTMHESCLTADSGVSVRYGNQCSRS